MRLHESIGQFAAARRNERMDLRNGRTSRVKWLICGEPPRGR